MTRREALETLNTCKGFRVIFEVKMENFQFDAGLVTDGNKTGVPTVFACQSAASMKLVCTAAMLATWNDLDVETSDMEHTCSTAPDKEKLCKNWVWNLERMTASQPQQSENCVEPSLRECLSKMICLVAFCLWAVDLAKLTQTCGSKVSPSRHNCTLLEPITKSWWHTAHWQHHNSWIWSTGQMHQNKIQICRRHWHPPQSQAKSSCKTSAHIATKPLPCAQKRASDQQAIVNSSELWLTSEFTSQKTILQIQKGATQNQNCKIEPWQSPHAEPWMQDDILLRILELDDIMHQITDICVTFIINSH